MSWSAGFAKEEITAWEPELCMMGWGMMYNRIAGARTPLYARAAAFGAGGTTVVFLSVELMAVTVRMRRVALERLQERHPELDPAAVIMAATHTHSGPSGYSEYFFMNLNGPGYSPVVFEAVVSGIVTAVDRALGAMSPAELRLASEDMPLVEPVAFNRSWQAYSRNEDVEPVTEDQRDSAVHRKMTVLSARSAEGELRGCISWFPVHCTSVHAENDLLHSDNKGLAATDLEREEGEGFVAIFAQEAAGDVTPNYRWSAARRKVIGHHDNDWESAQFAADAQRRLVRRLLDRGEVLPAQKPRVALHWVDFSAIEVSPRHGRGETRRTTVATLGLSMAEGTAEGPGPMRAVWRINRWLSRQKARLSSSGDPKVPMIDAGNGLDGRLLGVRSLRGRRLPPLDPAFAYIGEMVRTGRVGEGPWFPQVLPLQLVQLGPLLVAALPFEVTTVAGRRVRALLESRLRGQGVREVVAATYSNAYAGYCTTYEEYQEQHYEGGYTLFGAHQLGALLTMLEWMAERFDAVPRGQPPALVEEDALLQRRFEAPWPVKRARRAW